MKLGRDAHETMKTIFQFGFPQAWQNAALVTMFVTLLAALTGCGSQSEPLGGAVGLRLGGSDSPYPPVRPAAPGANVPVEDSVEPAAAASPALQAATANSAAMAPSDTAAGNQPVGAASVAADASVTGGASAKVAAPGTAATGALAKESAAAPPTVQLAAAELPPSALPAINAPAFNFAADPSGEAVADYFTKPRPVALPGLETKASERAWLHSAERPPRDLLPAADLSGHRIVPLERSTAAHLRPVVDLAPLGAEYESTRPERPPLPLAPRTRIAGPNPDELPALPAVGRMNEGALNLADDATTIPLVRLLLAPLGAVRTSGLPFSGPAPLDPRAHEHDLELENPPADDDRPARSTAPLPSRVEP
jgi:hypothetical protein